MKLALACHFLTNNIPFWSAQISSLITDIKPGQMRHESPGLNMNKIWATVETFSKEQLKNIFIIKKEVYT